MNAFASAMRKLDRISISDFLLTTAYDQERELYYNDRDKTCGFILEVDPVSGVGMQTVTGLTGFLVAKWPKDSMVQVVLYGDPNLDAIFNSYRRLRGNFLDVASDEIRTLLFNWSNKYGSYLDSKRLSGIDPREVPVPFRNFRSFISAKIPCSAKDFDGRSSDVQTLIENRETLTGILRTSHMSFGNMLPDEFIRIMYQIWNPCHPFPLPLRIGEDLAKRFASYESHASSTTAWELAEKLRKYGSGGKYANWFKGRYNIEFDKSFIVLELEELANSEELKQVVLMLIMASIEHKLYIEADRSRPTAIIMDEAWAMLTGKNTADFIEKGFRRARKYKGSFIVVTQSIFDLRDKNPDIGNAILANCAYRFILQPKEEEVRKAMSENLLPEFGKYELNLLLSTHTNRGFYSEIFIMYPNGTCGVGRLHVNRFTELLYTTNPSEIALIDEFRKRGLSMTESIERSVEFLPLLRSGVSLPELMATVDV